MIKKFNEFSESLNESLTINEEKLMSWQTGIAGTETPADGIYDAHICGCNLTIDGKDYPLQCGPKAHFFGPFRIEDGDVYMMPGTKQGLGLYTGEILIKDKEKGDRVASLRFVDSEGRWGYTDKKEAF